MAEWKNWSGRLSTEARELHFLRSEADAAALVRRAARDGLELRVAGAGHSHAPLVPTPGLIADLSGLTGVIATDARKRRVRVWAGTPIHALGRPLHDAGLALENQGDIDRQTLAGATATGTHGSGARLRNLSAQVSGVRLVLASGEIIDCSGAVEAELFRALRLHLGAFGVITQLEIEVREAYRLREQGRMATLAELMAELPDLAARHRHFEFFWFPQNDQAWVKTSDETQDPAEYPLAPEGQRCAYNYEVLANHRPDPHTEMEYAVPASSGPACLEAIARLLRSDFPDVAWPVEYRTLAADDVWLSQAFERDTVTISVHQDVRLDERDYYRACEEIFLAHEGRPHWGKLHGLSGAELSARHPAWERWWAQRDAVDPQGLFLNETLRAWR